MNTLIIIGWTGEKTAYLNISPEAALERFLADNEYLANDIEYVRGSIQKIEFEDSFHVYDAWM